MQGLTVEIAQFYGRPNEFQRNLSSGRRFRRLQRSGQKPLPGDRSSARAGYLAARAVWEAVCGNAVEAKRNAMAALKVSNGRDVE